MNYFFSIFFLTAFSSLSRAQQSTADLLQAERNFAAFSVQQGTKAAFLHYADSAGLVFERGKAVNAIAAWNKKQDRPGILNWHPVYGFMAAAGDLGFTTGPWTFQPRTSSDSVVARGQFNSVWHKNSQGEWKFLLDMGISNTPDFAKATFHFKEEPVPFTAGTAEDLQKAENDFIQQTKETGNRAKGYAAVVSKQAFLLTRNGHLPITERKDVDKLVDAMPASIVYQQAGTGISKSGDLGYVYGTSVIDGKEDSYLRIWRREGKAWKLALEVLPY
ncbi:nuclear transport factor 2 family protein [Flavisolibacter nicotianae]|uniref:nuclear transport factor 2 family protein n=1 Tax=Flavisolibacter nicotianae TaxID=2364882 RepID=UPI000EB3A374|nr:nuclear transport factor 2 family protein [Flavisolibacter nicotianae]